MPIRVKSHSELNAALGLRVALETFLLCENLSLSSEFYGNNFNFQFYLRGYGSEKMVKLQLWQIAHSVQKILNGLSCTLSSEQIKLCTLLSSS